MSDLRADDLAPAPGGESAPAHLVHSVEVIVEHAVEAAERSLAVRLGAGGMRVLAWAMRALMWLALIVYVVFCLTLISLRHWWMPHIDDWRGLIESRATATLKQHVTIGRIESSWQGVNPRLQLTDVQLHDAAGGVTLTLPRIDAVMSWTSVPTLQARVKSLTVVAPEIEVRRLSESRFKLAGMLIDLGASDSNAAGLQWLLEQHRVAVNQATVHYRDESDPSAPPGPTDLTEVDVLLTRGLGAHYFALKARPPSTIADVVDIRGWFDHPWSQPVSNMQAWSGRLYARLDFVDMARLESFARQIPEPFHLRRGNGAIRAWIDFNSLSVQRARADLAFTDVDLKLRADLPPLRLSSLQGRITQQAWNTGQQQGQDVTLNHLTLKGPGGLHLPPTEISYRVSRPAGAATPSGAGPQHNEVGASALSLQDLASLAAYLPLPAQTQDLIARYSMRGTLSDLHASWDDDDEKLAPVALRTQFSHLAVAAQPADPPADADGRPLPGTPGFENMTGSIDVSRSGGTLVLASSDARMVFPGVFDDPELAVGRLDAKLHWSTGARLELGIDSLAFSNDDLEMSLAGTCRHSEAEGAWADLSGNLTRAKVASLPRYVPVSAGKGAREWLTAALRAGSLSAGTFQLRGNLRQFPFAAPDSGDFQAALHVADATLDYAPSTPSHARPKPWPVMTGLDADLKFSRDQLEIRGNRAIVHGVQLAGVQGRIGPLDSRESHLAISGTGDGEIGELLGFVKESSVGDLIGGFLSSAQGSGPAHLQIKLDIPLNHSIDTDVAGSLTFKGNDVVLRPDIAPLSAVSGRLDFTQHGVRVAGLAAGYVGGQARIDVESGADGAVQVKVAGGATPQGLRRQIESGVVRRILDSARGLTKYGALLTVRANTLELHAVSDLAGLAIDLPEPIGKSAADRMPLRVDLVPSVGSAPLRDSVRVAAGEQIAVQLERIATTPPDGTMHIERGVVSLGGASALPESGLLVNVSMPRVDLDRWLPVLDSASGEAGAGAVGAVGPDLVAARVDEVTISGKAMQNVVLGATRAADGGWDMNVDADQTSGSLHWISGARPGQGKLTARLAHLAIPESAREPVAEVLDAPVRELPELDVIAGDFVLGTSHLGRLELDAQNAGSGRARSWQVKRLLIDNPDGRISGSGQWQREPGSQRRRMSLAITLDVTNGGNLLGRFGMVGALKNGSGKITGSLSWLGSPFSIDYPSLSGELHLNIDKGQFLKAEPGVARLLGVMSLQALPRRISLDFRDIFSQGFAFDTVRATAGIAKGVLATHDFKMTGVDATILIEGEADIQAETQNLHVLVLPVINAGSASLLWAFVANPAVGIGTFLAQWVLRNPLSKIFSYEYDLTGPWTDPQVKRHEQPKPESPAGPPG
jgi:uncharacterized protein (TIGR02099 family)